MVKSQLQKIYQIWSSIPDIFGIFENPNFYHKIIYYFYIELRNRLSKKKESLLPHNNPPLLKQQNHMQEEQKAINPKKRALNETMLLMK